MPHAIGTGHIVSIPPHLKRVATLPCVYAVVVQVPTQVDETMGEVCVRRSGRGSAAATTPPTPSPSTSAAPNTS